MNKTFLFTVAATVTLTACATTPAKYAEGDIISLPSVSLIEAWAPSSEKSVGATHTSGWLSRLNDPVLTGFLEKAYLHNPNLKRLQARLDRASAQTRKARAGLVPSVDIGGGGSRSDVFEANGQNIAALNLGIDVSWAPDLWGRTAAGANGVEFSEKARYADLEAGRRLLAANVAENYFLAIEAKKLAEVSARNLDALNKTLGFVKVQYERGLRSGQDLSLIQADVASAKVAFNRAEGASRDALRALEVLTGHYPQASDLVVANLPDLPIMDAAGQPSDILRQRPDLAAAQYRVQAAYQSHKSSKVAALPNFTLGGALGGNTNVVGQLFDPANLASTLFADLTAPILDGGARRADIAVAESTVDEAMADYQDLALNAFREVEQQIDQGVILAEQEKELEQALANANDALRFTEFRYESAETDLLNVLSVQQRVSFIESQLVSTRRARLVQYVNLDLSLGGEPT